jgi:hypothetical protein
MEIGRHDPKMPARSSSRPFEASKHIRVNNPAQLLHRLKVCRQHGRDNQAIEERFQDPGPHRWRPCLKPPLESGPVDCRWLTVDEDRRPSIQAKPSIVIGQNPFNFLQNESRGLDFRMTAQKLVAEMTALVVIAKPRRPIPRAPRERDPHVKIRVDQGRILLGQVELRKDTSEQSNLPSVATFPPGIETEVLTDGHRSEAEGRTIGPQPGVLPDGKELGLFRIGQQRTEEVVGGKGLTDCFAVDFLVGLSVPTIEQLLRPRVTRLLAICMATIGLSIQ